MRTIFLTGATGNVGHSVLAHLKTCSACRIIAGSRTRVSAAELALPPEISFEWRAFDFEQPQRFEAALKGVDVLFLLRPPHISDIPKYFLPLFEAMQGVGLRKVVFLSVQGADQSAHIPHHKIEQLILNHGFQYIFVRPSYFMQNLTTTLYQEVKELRSVRLPAGKARFNWVDVDDIGQACARLIVDFDAYCNQAYDITGTEQLDFGQALEQVNLWLESPIAYKPLSLVAYIRICRRKRMTWPWIGVMIMLHFLPRWQQPLPLSNAFEDITQTKPRKLSDFARRHAAELDA